MSKQFSIFAVQGPGSLKILNSLVESEILSPLPYFGFAKFHSNKLPCFIGQLGYTGERGFEIILPIENNFQIWKNCQMSHNLVGSQL